MAITNPNASDQLDAALANAQQHSVAKLGGTGKGTGTFHSMWRVQGTPLPGANPPNRSGCLFIFIPTTNRK